MFPLGVSLGRLVSHLQKNDDKLVGLREAGGFGG